MWKLGAAMVVAAVALSGCACGCTKDCANLLKLVFEDAAGNPLTPLQVTEGDQTHRCERDGGISGFDFVSCEGNALTYDTRNLAKHSIRAEATSGEVFSGEIDPEFEFRAPPGACCGDTFKPITLKLSAP